MSAKSQRRSREKACEYAALLMATENREDGSWVSRLWSATVFFEAYMDRGAAGTQKDFGPKKPPKLKVVA